MNDWVLRNETVLLQAGFEYESSRALAILSNGDNALNIPVRRKIIHLYYILFLDCSCQQNLTLEYRLLHFLILLLRHYSVTCVQFWGQCGHWNIASSGFRMRMYVLLMFLHSSILLSDTTSSSVLVTCVYTRMKAVTCSYICGS